MATMNLRPRLAAIGLACSATLGLSACSNAPRGPNADLADQAADDRLAALGRSLDWIAGSEASRPDRLDCIGQHARGYLADQVDDARRTRIGLAAWMRTDLTRPQERLPHVLDAARRAFEAHPERIEPNFISLFY
jgi:hypothetical protein